MGPLIAALACASAWLVVCAARGRQPVPSTLTSRGSWALAAVVTASTLWLAVSEVVVGSGEIADTAERVYVASSAAGAPGPLAVVAGTELALGVDLDATQAGTTETSAARVTSFELARRWLGVPVGVACMRERRASGADDARSYDIDAGRC